MSTVRLRRLTADANRLQEYVKEHPRLRMIQTQGNPPERYQIEYRIKCLRQVGDDLKVVKSHVVEIYLPRNYPRTPPQCRMLSPVFHPNIAPHAICVGDHWSAGESLFSIVTRIGEMLAFQSYNVKSPLNGEAARWVQEHEDELPLDHVSMLVEENKESFTDLEDEQSIPVSTETPPTAPSPILDAPPPVTPIPLAADQPPGDFAAAHGHDYAVVNESVEEHLVDLSEISEPSRQPPPSRPAIPSQKPARSPRAAAPEIVDDDRMKVNCPNCDRQSIVPQSAAGRKAQCLKCKTPFRIPTLS
jgi:ubiquitin-protein ligase